MCLCDTAGDSKTETCPAFLICSKRLEDVLEMFCRDAASIIRDFYTNKGFFAVIIW